MSIRTRTQANDSWPAEKDEYTCRAVIYFSAASLPPEGKPRVNRSHEGGKGGADQLRGDVVRLKTTTGSDRAMKRTPHAFEGGRRGRH
ncbi:hypothetical protein MRX96_013974 [Rhipicephalus microplus]